jgi:hypothetical protein
MVQSHAAGQPPLGEEAQLRDDAFIDLLDGVVIVSVVVLLIQNPANLTSPRILGLKREGSTVCIRKRADANAH